MHIVYIDTQKYGYDKIIIQENNNIIYQGKCGTIPIQCEGENIEITLLNHAYEYLLSKDLSLFSYFKLVLKSFFDVSIREPYYFKIQTKKLPFIQIQYKNGALTSNVEIHHQKIPHKPYYKLWLITNLLPSILMSLFFFVLTFFINYTAAYFLIWTVLVITLLSAIAKYITIKVDFNRYYYKK